MRLIITPVTIHRQSRLHIHSDNSDNQVPDAITVLTLIEFKYFIVLYIYIYISIMIQESILNPKSELPKHSQL